MITVRVLLVDEVIFTDHDLQIRLAGLLRFLLDAQRVLATLLTGCPIGSLPIDTHYLLRHDLLLSRSCSLFIIDLLVGINLRLPQQPLLPSGAQLPHRRHTPLISPPPRLHGVHAAAAGRRSGGDGSLRMGRCSWAGSLRVL